MGLSQEEMAERLRCARNYISLLENGKKSPSKKFLERVRILEVLARIRPIPPKSEQLAEEVHEDSPDDANSGPRARLKHAREAKGLSHMQLAEIVGARAGQIRDLEEGGAPINEPLAKKLAAALDIDADELLAGSDSPKEIDVSGVTGTVGAEVNIALPQGVHARYVPILSFAQAGKFNGTWIDEGYTHGGVVAMGLPRGARAFAVQIEGDSMEKKIEEGDAVVALWGMAPHQGDEVVVCLENDEVMCKVYHSSERGSKITLSSYNTLHPPLIYDRSEIRWVYPVDTIVKKNRRS